MLFFTRFLLRIASRNCAITMETFGVERENPELYANY